MGGNRPELGGTGDTCCFRWEMSSSPGWGRVLGGSRGFQGAPEPAGAGGKGSHLRGASEYPAAQSWSWGDSPPVMAAKWRPHLSLGHVPQPALVGCSSTRWALTWPSYAPAGP